jgi:hypothetical protein
MPKSVDELLALAAEGDEEAQAEIKNLFSSKEREATIAKRDLKLKTDATLRDRYPRALRAWDKGKLKLTEDMTEDALIDALKDKEDEYAELGVPVGDPSAAPPTPVVEPVASGESASDPAQALAGGKAASSPGGQPRDMVTEFFDALKGPTPHDRARAFAILPELNKTEGGKDKIRQITSMLEASDIVVNI